MKFVTLALATTLFPFLASAAQLTYTIDLEKSQMDEITAFDMCALPKEFTVNTNQNFADVVIRKTLASWSKKTGIQYIQDSSGSIGGGNLEEPFQGDYRIRVGIVHLQDMGYKGGVFYRSELNTYGDKNAPKAFTVDNELMNYRESAELAESSMCTGIAYRLK